MKLKFPKKIKYYADLKKHIKKTQKTEDNLIVMGDFNVAPSPLDIGIGEINAKRWLKEGKTAFLPEEIDMWNSIKDLGSLTPGENKIQMRIQFILGLIIAQGCSTILQKEA